MDILIAFLINAVIIVACTRYTAKTIRKRERASALRAINDLVNQLNQALPEISISYKVLPLAEESEYARRYEYPHTHTPYDNASEEAFEEIVKNFNKGTK